MTVTQRADPEDPTANPPHQPHQPHQPREHRFAAITPREWWGYLVWGFVGAVIATSELWAVAGNPWWLSISETVGHLENSWSPLRIIVVALIAAGAVQLLTYPPRQADYPTRRRHSPRWRTSNGRLTRARSGQAEPLLLSEAYFPAALIAVAAAGAAAAALGGSKFVVGYVIYGAIAVTLMIIPNVLAFFWAREVPFPTLMRTLDNLDSRVHSAVMIIVAGLTVLAIHLIAFPWP